MKTPLVVIIAIVAIIIGFLTFYSQQAGTSADKGIVEQGAAVSESAQAPAAEAPAAENQSSAPSGDHGK